MNWTLGGGLQPASDRVNDCGCQQRAGLGFASAWTDRWRVATRAQALEIRYCPDTPDDVPSLKGVSVGRTWAGIEFSESLFCKHRAGTCRNAPHLASATPSLSESPAHGAVDRPIDSILVDPTGESVPVGGHAASAVAPPLRGTAHSKRTRPPRSSACGLIGIPSQHPACAWRGRCAIMARHGRDGQGGDGRRDGEGSAPGAARSDLQGGLQVMLSST